MSSDDIKTAGRQYRHIDDPRTRDLFERILANQDVIKDSLFALENPALPDWIDATLLNGWVQFSDNFNKPQFTKLSSGLVMVRGLIKSGTTTPGTVLLKLPEGYRPDRIHVFASDSSPTAHCRVDVEPDGDVVIQNGSNTYFSLDPIVFSAYR